MVLKIVQITVIQSQGPFLQRSGKFGRRGRRHHGGTRTRAQPFRPAWGTGDLIFRGPGRFLLDGPGGGG